MAARCGFDYHNLAVGRSLAHGVAVTEGGTESRRRIEREASIMSYGRQSVWIDQCTYANLVDVLQAPPDPDVVLVRGRLARDGDRVGGELFSSYQLDGVTDLETAPGGDWALVVRDAAGTILGRFPFEPAWSLPDHGEVTVTSFSHRIPALSGLARIELVGPDGALDALTLSAHGPSVAVTSPANETYQRAGRGRVRVSWAAQDPDGTRCSRR
jgi:hypothetical protein